MSKDKTKAVKEKDGKLVFADARIELMVAAGIKQAQAEAIAKAMDME